MQSAIAHLIAFTPLLFSCPSVGNKDVGLLILHIHPSGIEGVVFVHRHLGVHHDVGRSF